MAAFGLKTGNSRSGKDPVLTRGFSADHGGKPGKVFARDKVLAKNKFSGSSFCGNMMGYAMAAAFIFATAALAFTIVSEVAQAAKNSARSEAPGGSSLEVVFTPKGARASAENSGRVLLRQLGGTEGTKKANQAPETGARAAAGPEK